MDLPRLTTRHFTRDLLLVFMLLSAGIIGAMVFFSLKAREDISEKYIDNAAAGAARQFEAMAQSMRQTLKLVADWVASGKASIGKPAELNGLLFPVFKRDRLLFGISVADTSGRSYYLTANGDGWRTSQTGDAKDGRHTVVRFWDADQEMVSEAANPSDYDARTRPWFSPALSAAEIFWTQPYPFFESRKVGITASIARKAGTENGQTVVAFDILLDELFLEIQRIEPSENSRVLIFRRDAQLYVPGTAETTSGFRSLMQIEDQLVRKMAASWEGSVPATIAPFSIRHANETWWCGFRPVDSADGKVWIGVIVPEADIIGGVNQRRTGVWTVGAVAILLAGGLAILMIRRYGRSFDTPEDRFDSGQPEESIRRLIAKGEGRTVEFKSTMRMNLHTQKPGKEIETAWLKAVVAFMNTDGGTLLLGVADDGDPVGLEADGFASEDKCRLHFKNLINQHIGAELSKYLRFDLVSLDGRQLGVVSCSRSSEPVFLKTGKNEAFFIRSGPSSDALPVSKVVSYIQNRN